MVVVVEPGGAGGTTTVEGVTGCTTTGWVGCRSSVQETATCHQTDANAHEKDEGPVVIECILL
jgi:hypothetical protein